MKITDAPLACSVIAEKKRQRAQYLTYPWDKRKKEKKKKAMNSFSFLKSRPVNVIQRAKSQHTHTHIHILAETHIRIFCGQGGNIKSMNSAIC